MNVTYRVLNEDARDFVIWVHQCYIPRATADNRLSNARLSRILTHKEEESECFALQFEAESTKVLHEWYTGAGAELDKELTRMFEDRVSAFTTLMEVISGD